MGDLRWCRINKNKVETLTTDAAALWRSLRSLPFLERLELTRVAFTPSHSPLSILDFTRVKELCLYKVSGLGADVLSGTYRMLPLPRSPGTAPREPVA